MSLTSFYNFLVQQYPNVITSICIPDCMYTFCIFLFQNSLSTPMTSTDDLLGYLNDIDLTSDFLAIDPQTTFEDLLDSLAPQYPLCTLQAPPQPPPPPPSVIDHAYSRSPGEENLSENSIQENHYSASGSPSYFDNFLSDNQQVSDSPTYFESTDQQAASDSPTYFESTTGDQQPSDSPTYLLYSSDGIYSDSPAALTESTFSPRSGHTGSEFSGESRSPLHGGEEPLYGGEELTEDNENMADLVETLNQVDCLLMSEGGQLGGQSCDGNGLVSVGRF